MLIKHGDLQPLTVIEPVDVSDEATKKSLNDVKESVAKSDEMGLKTKISTTNNSESK